MNAQRHDLRPAVHAPAATIVALHAYAAEICDAEVARALARLGALSPNDAFVVRGLAQRIIGELLHRPMTVLTADDEGANMARVLRRLFHLELEAEQLVITKPTPQGAYAHWPDTMPEPSVTRLYHEP